MNGKKPMRQENVGQASADSTLHAASDMLMENHTDRDAQTNIPLDLTYPPPSLLSHVQIQHTARNIHRGSIQV